MEVRGTDLEAIQKRIADVDQECEKAYKRGVSAGLLRAAEIARHHECETAGCSCAGCIEIDIRAEAEGKA